MTTTDQILAPVSGARRPLLWILGLSVIALFVTSFMFRLSHPWSERQPPQAQAQSAQDQGENAALAALMQRLQANPDDPTILLDLARHFTHLQDWTRSEHFARRLTGLDAKNFEGLYLLGMAEHGLGRHQESAAKLEQALTLSDDPFLRYSLAVLYAYYLDNKAAALTHVRQALTSPEASSELKKDLELELKNLSK